MDKVYLKLILSFLVIVTFGLIWTTLSEPETPKKLSKYKMSDGPYIFFHPDEYHIKSVFKERGEFLVAEEKIKKNRKHEPVIICRPMEDDSFRVRLRAPAIVPNHHYTGSDRILCISDIDGNFNNLKRLLIGNGVIDEQFNWNYGNGHLVILGDVFDRGIFVTECLWLIYELERQAKDAGGRVHFLLGNHEVMALSGDYRYLKNIYKKVSNSLAIPYKDLFGAETILGNWIRSKNTVEIIDNIMFVHAGISMELASSNIDIKTINRIIRENIGREHNSLLEQNEINKLIFGSYGPLWYRGYFENPPDSSTIAYIFNHFNIQKMVVGHTHVSEVSGLLNGKVFAIDAKKNRKSEPQALLLKDGVFYRTNPAGKLNLLNYENN